MGDVARGKLGLAERAFGWIGGAMVLVALYLLVFGGGGAEIEGGGPPAVVEMLSPRQGEAVDRPLEIVFRTEAPISVQPGGWGAGGYHLHAELSGTEVMPGGPDIRRLEDGSYSWTIPAAPRGELVLRLLWSDAAHRPVAESATEEVRVTVR